MSLYYPRVSRIHSTWPAVTAAAATVLRVGGGPGPDAPRAAVAGVVIDPVRRTAVAGGRLLKLTYMEFELLAHLVAHPLRVYSRRQLLTGVWDQEPFGDTRTVDVHVARLRRKLGPELRDTIATVRQVGYCYDPGRPVRP
ncbi:winged helix-turn-helix domain-containing protein [Kitasatospora sp. NPDC088346]|uniref:winged helix-turn-helix domain-containing protein n=1 Tax=Kitasatospora sp. NPDC088346 TaxID=3364073 RepID=UPI003818CA81